MRNQFPPEDLFFLGQKAIIRNKDGNILLLKRSPKKQHTSQTNRWELPGGRIQKGEDLEQAFRREIEEETGITNITNITKFETFVRDIRLPYGSISVGLIIFVFLCDVENTTDISLSNEHTEYEWYTPDKVYEILKDKYDLEIVAKIKDLDSNNNI